MAPENPLFDGEFLKKLEYLYIISKRAFSGQFKAERRARTRGTGLEFADHRAYSPGDDFRHVDWKAYQRLNKLLLRLFEEEQDLPIFVFLDSSRSMFEGTPPRFHYAQKIAAALCYIGLAHLDRVSLFAYSDHLRKELAPQRGKGQIFKIFKFLSDLRPEGKTDTKEALTKFCASRSSHGVAVVISDFMDPQGFTAGLNVLRHSHHEIYALHVTGQANIPQEIRGELKLVDSETEVTLDLEIKQSLISAYQSELENLCNDIKSYCRKYRIGYVHTDTTVPFEEAILQVFRHGGFLR